MGIKLITIKRKNNEAYYAQIHLNGGRKFVRCVYNNMKLMKHKEGHKKLAERFIRELEKDIYLEGRSVEQVANNHSPFLSFAERYMNSKINLSTQDKYRQAIRNFKECFGEFKTFQQINLAEAQKFKAFLLHKYKQNTARKHMLCISAVFNEAIRHDLTKTNPLLMTQIPVLDVIPSYLLENEIRAILKLDLESHLHKARAVFLTQCYLGLRISDLMKFNDLVNWQEGYIEHYHKKTNQPFRIPVSDNVKEILKDYDYKLPFISQPVLNRYLKTIALMAGINKKITTHTAKHTFISLLANNGVDLQTISTLLNQSPRMIQKVYLHVYDQTKVDAINKLPKL